jgi:drug/metabolite transporter (DMT)-like permease
VTGSASRVGLRYALIALAAVAWGTWPLILRAAEARSPMPASLEACLVMVMMTVVSSGFLAVDRVRRRARLREWLGVAWLGVADSLNILLYFAALGTTSVAIAVLTHYLTPILVALAAPVFLRERATRATSIAVAIAFAGLVLLLEPWADVRPRGMGLGALLGAGSAVFYASNVIVNKRLVAVFSTSELIFFHGVVATPLLALAVPSGAWHGVSAGALAIMLAGGLGPGALAGLAFVWGLRGVPAAHASTLALLEPLVAVLVGVAALGETLNPIAWVGGTCIVAGAWIVSRSGRA